MTNRYFSLNQSIGHQPFRCCRYDRRFSYGLYVPHAYTKEGAAKFRILVVVHGSEREPEVARELMIGLAEETSSIVLAPLFPMAVTDDEEMHNYLFLCYRDIRFDLILLAMVDEVGKQFDVSAQRFWMAGFSGGGQFAHRFMYLHASRLEAVSIGAPGIVNTLDPGRDWLVGVRDVRERLGLDVDGAGLRSVKVQVVVGEEDVSDEIVVRPGNPLFAEGVNDSGLTRLARARFLHHVLCNAGVASRFDIVQGARHSASEVQLAVNAFFRECHYASASERIE